VASGGSQHQSQPPSTERNAPPNWGEGRERWKGQLEGVSGTVGGITRLQLPKVGSKESSSSSSEMPVDPGRGISQLHSSNTGSHPPHPRKPEVSTNTRRGISPVSPSGNFSSARPYRPPSSQRDMPRLSPSY